MDNYLVENNIKHILSRPHHQQTNGALERYHRELHKYIYNAINEKNSIGDDDIEEAIFGYIDYHNNKVKSSTKFTPNQIRDLNDNYQINIIIENMIKASKKI